MATPFNLPNGPLLLKELLNAPTSACEKFRRSYAPVASNPADDTRELSVPSRTLPGLTPNSCGFPSWTFGGRPIVSDIPPVGFSGMPLFEPGTLKLKPALLSMPNRRLWNNGVPSDFSRLMENTIVKIVINAVIGGVMGVGLGFFMSALDNAAPPPLMKDGKELPPRTWKQELRASGIKSRAKMSSMSRNFAGISAVWGGTDHVITKIRGKHDLYNSVGAGLIAGAGVGLKSGPTGMAISAGGFALFSVLIDKLMGHH